MRQPYSSLPLLLFKGIIVFLDASGKIVQMKLDTHTHETNLEGLEQPEVSLLKRGYLQTITFLNIS